jgi:biopolymer transport protein ExbD
MRIHRPPRSEPRINLSPLIDVIFILLIFVFLVARFIDQERMDVEIPTSTQGTNEQRVALVLYLDQDGALRFEGAPLPREKLATTLKQRRAAYEDMLLLVDRRLSVQDAVDVLTVARAVGYERVGIATQEPP